MRSTGTTKGVNIRFRSKIGRYTAALAVFSIVIMLVSIFPLLRKGG